MSQYEKLDHKFKEGLAEYKKLMEKYRWEEIIPGFIPIDEKLLNQGN